MKPNHLFNLLSLTALCCLTGQALAQTSASLTDLNGGRHDGPGRFVDSNASFRLGMTKDSGATFVDTARLSDTVQIRGEITPEEGNIGQPADIFVVDRLGPTSFRMRNQDGVWVTWNGSVSALVPFREDVVLGANVPVEMFSGTLGTAGVHRLFLGYMAPDGILRYHVNALTLTITEQTALEQANALFSSRISPDTVQGICISCHFVGTTVAPQAAHAFVEGSSSSALATNFTELRNLNTSRGSSYILSKVTGGSGHQGGALMSTTSQEYKDLQEFLNLLNSL